MSATIVANDDSRWSPALIHERWESFTQDEREAVMRFGGKPAPWESTPDTALRWLKCDPKIELHLVLQLDKIFRAAYNELASPPVGEETQQ